MEIGTVYVTAQGSKLTKVGERLVVRSKKSKVLLDAPFFRIRQILCFGSVEISNSALIQLHRREIDVVFLTISGRYKCRLSNMVLSSVECRIEQYKKSLDQNFRLDCAKQILKGKLNSSKYWFLQKSRRSKVNFTQQIASINACLELIEEAKTTDELLGIEGTAAKAHFGGFKQVLKQNLGFTNRNRRPPKDPVNALLSFGYTLLFFRVQSAIQQAGLDPCFSNLHAIQDRRYSLALDLMEEFRISAVDTVVARAVNLIQFKPEDFYYDEIKGTRMTKITIARYVKLLQDKMSYKYVYGTEQKKYQLKDIIIKQIYLYKSLILGKTDHYQATRLI